MHLLLRAIITGFGYKIGSELGRLFAERVGLKKPEASKTTEEQQGDDMPAGLPDEPEESTPHVKAV